MPVTLNNTNITINDGTNNFVLETVKTHVPEVDIDIDIVPAITYPDTTTRNLQLAAETATGVNGWRIVRFLPLSLGRWYTGNYFTTTNMEVTASLGTAYNYDNEFMVPFGTYDEIWFGTYDMQYWVYTYKSSVLGNYSDSPRNVISSSVNPNPHTIEWYNRTGASIYDPVITHINYGDSGFHRLYVEDQSGSDIPQNGGMCVFVRSSTDTISSSIIPAMPVYEDTTHQLQNLAEQKTGVKGWIHVKHLPASSSTWYSGDGNLQGTYNLNETTKLDSQEWSILWNNKNEILFSKDTFNKWLRINSADITSGTGWTIKTAIDGINGVNQSYRYNGYDVGSYNPNIHWNTGTDYTNDTIYVETGNGVNWAGTPTKPYVDYDVFVRSSTDTVTVNPEPDYKILTFEYHGPSYPVIDADAASLVAHYKFDGDFKDSSENGNDLIPSNVSTPTLNSQGIIGNAMRFVDGVNTNTITNGVRNGTLKIPTIDLVNSEFSISFWFKQVNTLSINGVFVLGENERVDLNGSIEFYTKVNELKYIYRATSSFLVGGFIFGDTFPAPQQDKFYHIVLSVSSTDLKIYVDNNLRVTETSALPDGIWDTNYLGCFQNPTYVNTSSDFILDDFRIYNKALSATEISDLYNQYNQTVYTVNFQAESECDILIVGGGGGGGMAESGSSVSGAGGGAGGLIFLENQTIPTGNYTIKVGNGANAITNNNERGRNGFNSSFSYLQTEAIGGGGGGTRDKTTVNADIYMAGNGGSGGGGVYVENIGGHPEGGSGTVGNILKSDGTSIIQNYRQGYDGGDNVVNESPYSGGGGGAGGEGKNSNETDTTDGDGGVGKSGEGSIDFKTLFGITDTNIGEHHTDGKVYFAGGGGNGERAGNTSSGGLGGGGDGLGSTGSQNGLNNTGGGGAGGSSTLSIPTGAGGSGIVIIRYYTKYIRQHPAYDAQWTYHSANPNVHHYGNVGIGTLASETNKLTVKGDINVIGDIYENNNKIAYGWDVSENSVYNQYGNVGIGTNDPRYALHTTGVIYAGQGGITETGSTTWTITSDNRIKENIEKASYDICSENIKNINLYRFNYNTKYVKTTDKNQLGFIAQDVRKYFPKAVKNKTTRFDNDVVPNLLSVDVTQLNYTMYGAVKHIGQDIDAIKEKLGITEVPNDVKNQPYFTEVIPFNDPDAELPIVNEEPATN